MDDINGKKDLIEAILKKNIPPKVVDIKDNSGSFESSDLGQEEVPYLRENNSYLETYTFNVVFDRQKKISI